jgi:hypothetical protein
MVRSFQQFFDKKEELHEGSSNIIFGRNNEEKEFELVSDIGNYENGHTFKVSNIEHENATIIEVGRGMSSVTVLDEYDEPVSFIGSSSKINLLFDEIIPTQDDVVREEVPPIIIREEIVGSQGKQGTQGFQGIKGADGKDGLHGIPGEDGKDGEVGPQGEQGIQGEVGPQGEQGIQGEVGPQGEKGNNGDRGGGGLPGIRGEQGIQGLEGKQGKQGPKGDRGKKGEQGVRGVDGKQGKSGTKGVRGVDGKQGKSGTKGERGIQGKQGLPGTKGINGRDGKDGVDGKDGQEGFMDVQFPLKYDDKKKRISVDTKVLQKMLSVPANKEGQFIDWVALAGGGAVGIRDDSSMVIKSVSDLNFKGNAVSVERKGKDVELTFTDTGTFTESASVPSSPQNGDRWHDTTTGKLYTYVTSESAWIEF